ncbi:MAG TPA: DNA-3-methyladenine glycosylase [Jiangellaceae bacterium]
MSDSVGRAFFERPVLEVAPSVLGCVLVNGPVAVRLTEVEAYDGPGDPGSHAYRGRTARNAVMFGPAGHVYVYFTYGMHWCANLVCGPAGTASAVLLRAGEVVTGLEAARSRRPSARADRELARGPARLAAALGLGGADNGTDLCDGSSRLRLQTGTQPVGPVRTGPRVGLSRAGDRPWRFWLDGDPTVSTYRPHLPRRRSAAPRP